jgi:hypothetical protein
MCTAENLVLAGTSLFCTVTQQINCRNEVLYLSAVTASVPDNTEVERKNILPNYDTALLKLRPVQQNLT